MSTTNNGHFSLTSLFGVKGLVAVVTGGGSGLGLYIAKALDYNGAKAVYIIGRRQETLDNAVRQATNGTIIPIQGDVTSKSDLTRIAEQIKKEQGYINVLYANSGIIGISASQQGVPTGGKPKPSVDEFVKAMWEPEIEDFTKAFHINVSGAFYSTLAFLPLLEAGNKHGGFDDPKSSIVVTTSIAGLSRQLAAGFPYSTSKAGATHLVKMMSTYFADWKIRVNAIAPGMFPSEMTAETMKEEGGRKLYEEGGLDRKVCPLERSGKEEEMAGTAIYMASRAGGYMNGNVVVIDGGRLGELPASY